MTSSFNINDIVILLIYLFEQKKCTKLYRNEYTYREVQMYIFCLDSSSRFVCHRRMYILISLFFMIHSMGKKGGIPPQQQKK